MGIASDQDQGHEVCFFSPWMKLVAIPAENGTSDPHYVVVAKDYVSVVAMLDDGNLLAVRQQRPAVGCKTLEFPAGHVETGQTPEQAAHQELLEETGYRAASMTPLGVVNPDTGRLANRHWCFFASGLERAAEGPRTGENIEAECLSVAELRRLVLNGEFNHAQHLAALQLAVISGKVSLPASSGLPIREVPAQGI
jgi:ADP-ribose diphosphatase